MNLTELQRELVGKVRHAVYENLEEMLKYTNMFREFRDADPNSPDYKSFQKLLGSELPELKELALKANSFYYGSGSLIPFNFSPSKPQIRTLSIPFGGMTRKMRDDWRRKLP